MPLNLKQTFQPIIWIFTGGEGDGIESRLPFKIFLYFMINFLIIGKQETLESDDGLVDHIILFLVSELAGY